MHVFNADALGALMDVNQPVLVAVDQRFQQHPADHAEDGGVRANAQCQRQDDRESQAFRLQERTPRKSQIGQKIHRHTRSPPASSRTRTPEIDIGIPKITVGSSNTPAYLESSASS